MLWQRILSHLSPRLNAIEVEVLRDLQQADIELLRASTEHVRLWNADSISADWNGYRSASLAIRDKMAAGIAVEKECLYPLLAAAAEGVLHEACAHGSSLTAVYNQRRTLLGDFISDADASEKAT